MSLCQQNSVFSCEFWWRWVCFEGERNAAFPNSFRTLQAETDLVFASAYLCLTWQSTTGKQLRENKSQVKVVSQQRMQIPDFEEYQSRMIQSCQMLFPPSSMKWIFCRKRPDSAELLHFQQISFLLMESCSIPALFPARPATYPFLGWVYSFTRHVSLSSRRPQSSGKGIKTAPGASKGRSRSGASR